MSLKMDAGGGEMDLTDMHRKYRIMENNRKNYSEDSQAIIKRQRQVIDKIKMENEKLQTEYNSKTQEDNLITPQLHKHLLYLQDQADIFSRKIELERRRLDELDQACQLAHSKMLEKRAQLGGCNAAKEDDVAAQKQVKVLENRLDKALLKFNEALSNNKVLREEIDGLRRERAIFDEIYAKLQRDLQDKKKEIANVIEISNISYEARDQAQNEIAALKAQADKEYTIWHHEMQELWMMVEHEKRLQDQMRRDQIFNNLPAPKDEEDQLKIANTYAPDKSTKKNDSLEDHMAAKVSNYDEVFAKIQAATGIAEMDELVLSFIKAEDKNYSLFNFANELNQDIERLEEVVQQLQEDETTLKGEDAVGDTTSKSRLKVLQGKLTGAEGKTKMYNEKGESGQDTIEHLKAGIEAVLASLEIVPKDPDLLSEGVTEQNLVVLLGLIEQRGNEIMQTKAKCGSQAVVPAELALSGRVLGTGPHAPPGAGQLVIQPPTTTDDQFSDDNDSDDEFDDRPLTRNELEAKTLRNISKRDSRGARRARHKK
eukprot:CAMPEP_0198197548 /NCGR_PEP_ID=MMETSP1445-20131203/1131_1 /TAXON_ID=36898 /ORGANISM="Pyramimonas sp., Strain CCMP2087" /LENGTH=540 /DNA_ID=CAMNT_0043866861 /DNA_START=245 /DNA_END=1867 /DNA_ORIENTATION=-